MVVDIELDLNKFARLLSKFQAKIDLYISSGRSKEDENRDIDEQKEAESENCQSSSCGGYIIVDRSIDGLNCNGTASSRNYYRSNFSL